MSETPVDAPADAGGRERLLAKLNGVAGNIVRRRERHGEAPPREDDSTIAEAALDAPQAVDSQGLRHSRGLPRLDIA